VEFPGFGDCIIFLLSSLIFQCLTYILANVVIYIKPCYHSTIKFALTLIHTRILCIIDFFPEIHATSKKEVREVIFQMKHNKAPGPDGFRQSFFKRFGVSSKMT
jgi:hypothetical protein